MSKRTEATKPARRRRRGLPRLSDVRIQSKLGLILLVPILAAVALAGVELESTVTTLIDARQVTATVTMSNQAGSLIERLQHERLAAAETMLADPSQRGDPLSRFKQAVGATNKAVASYHDATANVNHEPTDLTSAMRTVDSQLKALSKSGRAEVLHNSPVTVASVAFQYKVLISQLLAMQQTVVKNTTNRGLSGQLSANAAIAQAKEDASQEQLALFEVLVADGGTFDAASYQDFLATLTGQQNSYDTFTQNADGSQLAEWTDRLNGHRVQASTTLETDAFTVGVGGSLDFSVSDWNAAMQRRLSALRTVEVNIDGVALAHAKEIVSSVVRTVIVESASG
ncbi:MAG: nitrate- and nitrite sensing domain-containing protein, partial [Mycobacterium sp.]|nr:nitrate- and nitrite sensing domain-containing protein [Mycobacterium sp.]